MIWMFTIHQWIQHQIQILYMNSEGADHTTSQCRMIGIFTIHQCILHQRKILYEHSKCSDHTTRIWSRSGPSLFTSHFYTNQWLFMCIIKVLITLQGCARRSGPRIFTIWIQHQPKILSRNSKDPDHSTRLCRMIWSFTIHQWLPLKPKIRYLHSKDPDHTTRLCRMT